MKKNELKKEHLLKAGLEVMKANGYNGTSVKDIVDAAGVPKGSFYNYFESKQAFGVEAIEAVAEQVRIQTGTLLGNTSIPPLDRLQQFFSLGIDDACTGDFKVGCFLGNMCQEMSDNCDVLRSTINNALTNFTSDLETVLIEAQSNGSLSPDRNPRQLAEFLLNSWEGALMRMKASKCNEPLQAFLTMLPILCSR
jgi:TetR/AcrR family transcriptional repressor of nem operon